MSVEANGQVIFGYVHTDETADIFSAIQENEDEELSIDELHQDEQERYDVTLVSVGYASIDLLYAFSANASGKGFDNQAIDTADMAKTDEYTENIKKFLAAISVTTTVAPGWHILSYMD